MLSRTDLASPSVVRAPKKVRAERLESWKEIASFLGREVRTVQLWEKHEALPVHRHIHRKQGSVYAFCQELEAWQDRAVRSPERRVPPTAGSVDFVSNAREEVSVSSVAPIRLGIAPFDCMDESDCNGRLLRGLQQELLAELFGRSVETHLITEFDPDKTKGRSCPDLRTTVEALNLGGYLTGNVSRNERRVRVNVQLFCGRTLHCAWSMPFESAQQSLVDTLCELAKSVVAGLPLHLLALEARRSRAPAQGDAAEQAYLKGRYLWGQRNGPVLRSAEECFHESIRINPRFSDAYAGLADCYVSLAYSQILPCHRAHELANQALASHNRLSTNRTNTHSSLANVHFSCNFDFDATERECALACERDSENPRGLQLYSMLAGARGQHQRAIDYALSALRLDPASKVLNNEVGYAFFFAGDYDRAAIYVRRALAIDPEFIMGYVLSGMVEIERRGWDTAIEAFDIVSKTMNHPTFAAGLLAHLHAAMGDRAGARAFIERVNANPKGESFPYLPIAAAHAQLGDRAEAMLHLERAKQERDAQITHLASDPRFFSLHSAAEFRDLATSIQCA